MLAAEIIGRAIKGRGVATQYKNPAQHHPMRTICTEHRPVGGIRRLSGLSRDLYFQSRHSITKHINTKSITASEQIDDKYFRSRPTRVATSDTSNHDQQEYSRKLLASAEKLVTYGTCEVALQSGARTPNITV